MPERKYSLDGQYRFGFNGKENDNETHLQNYGFRMYESRLGRFISMDPITSDYPFYTPYQFAGNKPIIAADLDGLEEWMKSQELAVKQRAQIQMQIAADHFKNVAVVRPYNPGDKSWTQRWRDSKNFLAQVTYSGANGLYTLPQQLGASLTGQRYISNIGGHTHEAHGPFGEKQRLEYGINGLTMFVPSAAAEQKAASWLGKYADNALVSLENEVTEQVIKKSAYEIALDGGRHAGFLKTYLNKSIKELEKGISNMSKGIMEHQNLINDPEKYMKQYNKGEWQLLDPRQQKALLEKKWPGDIQRLTEQKQILEGVLKSKI